MLKLRDIDHVVLRVRDIEAMSRFYCDVLGASKVAYRPEFGMTHLRVGGSMIDLVAVDGPLGKPGGAAPGKEGRNMDHVCLRVDPFDQDAIVVHLKKHDVTVGEIRTRFGAEGHPARGTPRTRVGPHQTTDSKRIRSCLGAVLALRGSFSAGETAL